MEQSKAGCGYLQPGQDVLKDVVTAEEILELGAVIADVLGLRDPHPERLEHQVDYVIVLSRGAYACHVAEMHRVSAALGLVLIRS